MNSKRALIIKDDKAKIIYKGDYLQIITVYSEQVIGFEQIESCYINQNIDLKIKTAMQIAKKIPLFFINKNGIFIAKLTLQV